jgi:hypothetical protein
MVMRRAWPGGSGRLHAAQLACGLLIAAGLAQPALGQAGRPVAPAQRPPAAPLQRPPAAAAKVPVPDQLTSLKMVWSVMAAVDHANRTGNYSVLRDLGTPAFQANNNPANLAGIFARLREQRVDLSDTLVVTPIWEIAPQMASPTVLRMRGMFPLRPQPIAFDLLFSWDRGWRLEGIAVQAIAATR